MKIICESQIQAKRYYFMEMFSGIESLSSLSLNRFQWVPNSLHMDWVVIERMSLERSCQKYWFSV